MAQAARVETGDASYFGPHSVTWRIHSNPVTLLGGIRALLIQALHPLAMAGVLDHSDMASDVFGRFRRTSDYLVVSIFGDRAAADEMGARVRAMHRHVSGVDRVTGLPYRTHQASCPLVIFLAGISPIARILTAVLCRPAGVLTPGSRAVILMEIGIPAMSMSVMASCI